MDLIQKGKANVIIDGQWGSSGKGKLAGYLYDNYQIDVAVCDYMPNAGHTVYIGGDDPFVFRQLPVGAAYEHVTSYIGPHAAIDVKLLLREINMIRERRNFEPRIKIHPLAAVIMPSDCDAEQSFRGGIASTAKGGHYATAAKTTHPMTACLVKDYLDLTPYVGNTQEHVCMALGKGKTVLVETAQGFDLGLNHGFAFPYVTGRDCMVGRALDNAGVPVSLCGSIIGAIRTFPIRVGSTGLGSSGPCYSDQVELSWDAISRFAGRPVSEMTTVTKRVRRVFSFSWLQLHRFLLHVRPTHMFLNFINYLDAAATSKRQFLDRLDKSCALMDCELKLIGDGAAAELMLTRANGGFEWPQSGE